MSSSAFPPATQAPPIKTHNMADTNAFSDDEAPDSAVDDVSSQTEELHVSSPIPMNNADLTPSMSQQSNEAPLPPLATQAPPMKASGPGPEPSPSGPPPPAPATSGPPPRSTPTPPNVAAQSSAQLLQDPKLQEILLSDVGSNALLSRLKQSIFSAREFATFVKKKSQLESEQQQAMKKLARNTREIIKRPDNRQGTFVKQFEEIVKSSEKTSDVTSTFAAALHTMHDELQELARTCEKSRKVTKERCVREEKNVSEAEQLAEKAKSKYDSLADDFEKMRTGDPTRNRFGIKQSKSAQHEEELHKKVTAAEQEYRQRVDQVTRLRQELVNKLRPVTVKELKNMILEIDAGISLQLAKYANLNETLVLNSGFIVSPLKPVGSATAPLTMKEVAAKVDNELDFYNHVLSIPKSQKLHRRQVQFRQHPSLSTSSYGLQKTMAPVQPATSQNRSRAASGAAAGGLTPQMSQPTSPPSQALQPQRSASGGDSAPSQGQGPETARLSPVSTANTTSQTVTSVPAAPYPPGTTSHTMPVFGTPLEELVDFEEGTVPRIVFQCVQAIDAYGLEVEGIYRQSGNASQVQEIRRVFDADSGAVDLLRPSSSLTDIHAVTSSMKQYFRELPDPLLTHEFHYEFLEAVRIDNEMARRDAIHATINKLPDANYSTLRYLVFHLYRVAELETTNRMSFDNLGIVWGPTLMASDYNNPEDMAKQGRIVSIIIANAYTIFDAD